MGQQFKMGEAHFILSKDKLRGQVKKLEDLGLIVSYSYKTNRIVGDILQENCKSVNFSIHDFSEIEMIKDKSKISFFTQAESAEELRGVIKLGVNSFVVDNKIDLDNLLQASKEENEKIILSLRMKFQEHRIGSGKYFVYGMDSFEVNKIIQELKENKNIESIGIHIHRKSQNTSEWEIKSELEDSITKECLALIDFVNLGGGLPSVYRSYTSKVYDYIFKKIQETKIFLEEYKIKTIIEPGRFVAAPCIKLKTKIIQIQENNIIINTSIYNCAIDTILTGTKMLLEEEIGEDELGNNYLIKGNSPTRDDIFRYKVRLKSPKVGDSLTFINAGAYNYATDFFGFKKLITKILD